ncbi:MAG: hypothetical protein DSY90_07685 [Deltaproteobacteria bacterium]|nr:MAG: hypothetical protein DSY90_07685 [Deltaproteobacteria bacterium]
MISFRFYLSALGLLAVLACAAPPVKTMFVLIPDAGGKTGRIVVKNDTGEQAVSSPGAVVEVKSGQTPPRLRNTMAGDEIETIFKDALGSRPKSSVRFVFYFKHDVPEFTDGTRKGLARIIDGIVRAARDCPPCDVFVVGHADTTGTDAHNFKLGLARAGGVAEQLIEAGLPANRVDISSHGEKDLFIPTPDDVLEPVNRRVEVIIR